MKNTIYRLVPGIILLFTSFAHCSAQQNSLLWEISGPDLKHPSYLFGTIHLICPEDFTPGDSLIATLQNTREMLLEVDPADPELFTHMTSMMFRKDGKKLSDLIPAEDYPLVKDFITNNLGMQPGIVEYFKPVMLNALISVSLFKCRTTESVERLLTVEARNAGVKIGGLETVLEQMAVIDSIPDSTQIPVFLETIRNLDQVRLEGEKLIDLYKSEDIDEIYRFTQDSKLGSVDTQQMMLKNRNIRWIPRIEEKIRQGSTFIAVGAGHLGGEFGLLTLLKARGYFIRPIPAF